MLLFSFVLAALELEVEMFRAENANTDAEDVIEEEREREHTKTGREIEIGKNLF